MGKEVEMKDANGTADPPKTEATAADGAGDAPTTPISALKSNVTLLEKAVALKDTRLLMGRLLRQTATVRKQLDSPLLQELLQGVLPQGSATRTYLLDVLSKVIIMAHPPLAQLTSPHPQADASMDTDVNGTANGSALPPPAVVPEVELYAYLLVTIFFCDTNHFAKAKEVSAHAVQWLSAHNRRTLDVLAARLYFYYSWAHERTDTLADVRSVLLALHRTAVLRHDAIGQETLLNLLLRNYLHYNLYDQAEKLRSKAQRPETTRSNQQACRYLYYLGRIRAIQLEYTEAKDCLQQAARKAPTVATAFLVTVNKWLILVRLLLGEIPERADFTAPGMRAPLLPYFELTQVVRSGDLLQFKELSDRHHAVFVKDGTNNLIVRLRHNVIRTGLRRINLAYSRISIADIAAKLGLDRVEDTECIVAKAIRDGGIEAVLDHEQGFMQSRGSADTYSTDEPQSAFHARIAFCLDIHNDAVKAMRFEPDAYRSTLGGDRRDRVPTEQEIARALEEDDEF